MSAEALEILYVGNVIAGAAFKECFEPLGWNVYIPADRIEALGMFINWMPHLVILDALKDPELVQDVYHHIRTVDEMPVIVVGAVAGTIGEIDCDMTRAVPAHTPLSTLAFLAQELVEKYP